MGSERLEIQRRLDSRYVVLRTETVDDTAFGEPGETPLAEQGGAAYCWRQRDRWQERAVPAACQVPGESEDAGEVFPLGQLSVRLDTYTPVSALCHR